MNKILKILVLMIVLIANIFIGTFDCNAFATEFNHQATNLLEMEDVKDFNQENVIQSKYLQNNLRALNSFNINLTPNAEGFGSVGIYWEGYDYRNKNFKVYKSSDGGKTYETIGIDYTLIDEVRLLNVYNPNYKGANLLKTWMEDNKYGKDIIKVTQVTISNFNSNPNAYLKDTDGNYKYQVIFFGSNDYGFDLNANSATAVEQYIKSGGGCICGHDNMVKNIGGVAHPYFWKLASYFGISTNQSGYDFSQTRTTKVRILKKGLFTNYPWNIGDVGTILTIPESHMNGQIVSTGTNWLSFANTPARISNTNYISYLVTKNNCAMVQTGHSNGAATVDEQKILANLIFYCTQLLYNRYRTIDSSAQDVANPNEPDVALSGNTFNFSADDNGSTYHYYVESYKKDDTTQSGLLDRSVIKSTTVTTGVRSYRYIYDNNSSTTVTLSNGTSTDSNIDANLNYQYLHVAAVDGAGNISNTTTIKLSDMYTVKYNGNGETRGTTEDSTHIFNVFKNLTPNGFERKYIVTFDHNYEGSENVEKNVSYTFKGWNTKANGKGTSFKDREQVKNIATQNGEVVQLYAMWQKESIGYKPTRPGYKFEGWYLDKECTKRVTKNEYVPTKDVTLYAKWKEIEYTTQYTIEYYYDNLRDNAKTERKDNIVSNNELKEKIKANEKEGFKYQKVEEWINDYNVIKIYYVSNNGSNPENPKPEEPENPIDPVTGERLYTITVDNNKPGHTYNSYQVFKGDYCEKEGKDGDIIPTLSNIEWGEELQKEIEDGKTHGDKIIEILKEQNPDLYKNCQTADDVAEVLRGKPNDGDIIREFTNTVGKYLLDNNIEITEETDTLIEKKDINGNIESSNYKMTNLEPGYYIVIDVETNEKDDSYSRYLIDVVQDVTMEIKSSIPTLKKKVIGNNIKKQIDGTGTSLDNPAQYIEDEKRNTATYKKISEEYNAEDYDIGFELKSYVPNTDGYSSYEFEVVDILSKGFDFDKDSVKLIVGKNEYPKTRTNKLGETVSNYGITDIVINSENYNIYQNYFEEIGKEYPEGYKESQYGKTLILIELKDLVEQIEEGNVIKGQDVIIKYNAKLNGKGEIGTTPNINEAYLKYSNDPYHNDKTTQTTTQITYTYTIDLDLVKIAELKNEQTEKIYLEGAEFEIYNEPKTVKDRTPIATITTDELGKVLYSSLGAGTYYIKETKSPEGYNKLREEIVIEVKACCDEYGIIRWTAEAKTNKNLIYVQVGLKEGTTIPEIKLQAENTLGFELPVTGGTGTIIFTLLGIGIMLVSVNCLKLNRKKAAPFCRTVKKDNIIG